MIAGLLAAVSAPAAPRGPGDDAAVLDGGHVVTVDTLVEGVHFDERLSGADVGYKTVAVSVSDLAAMGAVPEWLLLSVSLPDPPDAAWWTDFCEGVKEALFRFGGALIGGDTTRSPGPIVVSGTMQGRVERPVLRSGGAPGDELWITGTPGLAGAGYLFDDPPEAALRALRRPVPPLAFAVELAEKGLAAAMMDLSDGLRSDLPRLCASSGCGAEVEPARLPVHPALADVDPLPLQVAAGDDYQLLFAARPASHGAVLALADKHDVLCTPIGRLTADPAVVLNGCPWPAAVFAQFRRTT